MTVEIYAGRVVVDAFLFVGDNWRELAAWVGDAAYVGDAPQPGAVVMRVRGGVRALPREVFAITYWPRDRIPEAHRSGVTSDQSATA